MRTMSLDILLATVRFLGDGMHDDAIAKLRRRTHVALHTWSVASIVRDSLLQSWSAAAKSLDDPPGRMVRVVVQNSARNNVHGGSSLQKFTSVTEVVASKALVRVGMVALEVLPSRGGVVRANLGS